MESWIDSGLQLKGHTITYFHEKIPVFFLGNIWIPLFIDLFSHFVAFNRFIAFQGWKREEKTHAKKYAQQFWLHWKWCVFELFFFFFQNENKTNAKIAWKCERIKWLKCNKIVKSDVSGAFKKIQCRRSRETGSPSSLLENSCIHCWYICSIWTQNNL